jgi:hypothetical protein
MTVYHASTPDLGETVDGPTPIRATGLNFQPWIDARADGQVAVGFHGGNATGRPSEAGENATWHAYVAERQGANASFATTRVSDEPVKVGPLCPRNGCDDNDELLDFVGLTYAPDGRLHYGFAQSHTADENQSTLAVVHHAAEVQDGAG